MQRLAKLNAQQLTRLYCFCILKQRLARVVAFKTILKVFICLLSRMMRSRYWVDRGRMTENGRQTIDICIVIDEKR